ELSSTIFSPFSPKTTTSDSPSSTWKRMLRSSNGRRRPMTIARWFCDQYSEIPLKNGPRIAAITDVSLFFSHDYSFNRQRADFGAGPRATGDEVRTKPIGRELGERRPSTS